MRIWGGTRLRGWLVVGLVTLTAPAVFAAATSTMDAALDPSMDPATVKLMQADMQEIDGLQFQANAKSYFQKVFGSTDASGLVPYLNQRVHYIVPEIDDVMARLYVGTDPMGYSSGDDGNHPSPGSLTVARNIGIALWLMNIASSIPMSFQIGDQFVALDSARVGIVELGPGYTMAQTSAGTPITAALRTASLIHEARHSDCSGGPLQSDLQLVTNGEAPLNHKCGYTHVECPVGHSLAGLPACDDVAWGAYSVQGVFASTMANNCSGCDESVRQQALANATDAFSRVLVMKEMLGGQLGDPDMSSSDLPR